MRKHVAIALGLLAGLLAVSCGEHPGAGAPKRAVPRDHWGTTPTPRAATSPHARPPAPQLLFTLKAKSDSAVVALSPDGKTMVTVKDQTLQVWDLRSREVTAMCPAHGDPIWPAAFSHDSRTLAFSGADKSIRVWDVADRKTVATFEGHASDIGALAFSHDGQTLASASEDGKIKLWDVAERKNTATLEGDSRWAIESVKFSQDDKLLAWGVHGGTLRLLQLGSTNVTTLCDDNDQYVSPFTVFSPDRKTMASAAACNARQAVLLWDAATGKNTDTLVAHGEYGVVAMGFAEGGRVLISVGYWCEIKFWDVPSGDEIATFHEDRDGGPCYHFAALSADGTTLAAGTSKGEIEVWRLYPAQPATHPATRPGN